MWCVCMDSNQADHMLSQLLCKIQRDKVLEIKNMEGHVIVGNAEF